MEIITKIFEAITSTSTAAMTLITGLFESVIGIFWTGTQVTTLGLIILIPAGIGVVFWILHYLFGLIKSIKVGKKG